MTDLASQHKDAKRLVLKRHTLICMGQQRARRYPMEQMDLPHLTLLASVPGPISPTPVKKALR